MYFVLVLMYCRCVGVYVWVGGCQCVGVGASVCVGGHGMAALQSVGSVGSVGSGWIGSLFHSPPTCTFQSVCRCLISVVQGRYLGIGGTCRLFLLVR